MEYKIGSMRSRALSGIVEMTSFLFATFAMCSFAFVIIHQGHERSLANKHLGNGEYFVIIASSSHPLLGTFRFWDEDENEYEI